MTEHVTVEGVPLSNYLEDKKNKSKTNEVGLFIKGTQKLIRYTKPRKNFRTNSKHGAVIISSGREIMMLNLRNEMRENSEKLSNTQMVLGIMMLEGGRCEDMSKKLIDTFNRDIKSKDVSNLVSKVKRTRLKDDFRKIKMGKQGPHYEYVGPKRTLEEAYQIFKDDWHTITKNRKDGITTTIPTGDSTEKDIEKSIAEAAIDAALNASNAKEYQNEPPFILTLDEIVRDCIEKGISISINIGPKG